MSRAQFFGFNAPFFGGAQNILSRQEDERLIKNDLLQLLLTSPGERVFRPDLGTLIRESLFEPLDNQTIDALDINIREQIELFEPRVSVSSVDIAQDPGESTLTIKIFGSFVLDKFAQARVAEAASLILELELPIGQTTVI